MLAGFDYTPTNPRLSKWFLILWRGDYDRMLQHLEGLPVSEYRLVKVLTDHFGSGVVSIVDSFDQWVLINSRLGKFLSYFEIIKKGTVQRDVSGQSHSIDLY